MVPVNKEDPSTLPPDQVCDVRPISIGHAFRRLITRVIYNTYIPIFNDLMKPCQYAVGERSGITQMLFGLQGTLHTNPDHVVISTDVENNFNEVMRQTILQEVWAHP